MWISYWLTEAVGDLIGDRNSEVKTASAYSPIMLSNSAATSARASDSNSSAKLWNNTQEIHRHQLYSGNWHINLCLGPILLPAESKQPPQDAWLFKQMLTAVFDWWSINSLFLTRREIWSRGQRGIWSMPLSSARVSISQEISSHHPPCFHFWRLFEHLMEHEHFGHYISLTDPAFP